MGGKAKPTKHTAKEIAGKHHEAKMKNGGRGGGAEGIDKRKAPKEGKRDIFLKCEKCLLMQPSLKSMSIHYESKHPKEDWEKAILLYTKSEEEQNKKNLELDSKNEQENWEQNDEEYAEEDNNEAYDEENENQDIEEESKEENADEDKN